MSTNRLQRTHRSTKIPNVKLRPVPHNRSIQESVRAAAEDDAHFHQLQRTGLDQGAHSAQDFHSSKPLQGITLSFTGIVEDKVCHAKLMQQELIQIAEQLGAKVHRNLTSEVTHLIARKPGSEKYRCAVRFGMHVIRPEWLYTVREAWLCGEDHVDVDALAMQARLGALEQLHLAFSGVDSTQRDHLQELIHGQGGSVAPRLTLDGSITHLVCGPDDGRTRKSYARILEYKTLAEHHDKSTLPPNVEAAAHIQLVHAAWVEDCCKYHVLLPEDKYDARRPLDPPDLHQEYPVAPPIRSRASIPERTLSVPDAKPKNLSGILDRVHSVSFSKNPQTENAPKDTPCTPSSSSLLTFSRADRFHTHQRGQQLFQSIKFHVDLLDEARTRRVASVIRSHAGVLCAEKDATYLVRPLVLPSLCAVAPASRLVTHHWIELCIHNDQIIDPNTHIACVPTTASMPIPNADKLCFSFTGFDRQGPQYHHALAVIHAIGAQVQDAFGRANTTHLICSENSASNLKVQKAHAWNIPVKPLEFLSDLLHTGKVPTPTDHAPNSPVEPISNTSSTLSRSSHDTSAMDALQKPHISADSVVSVDSQNQAPSKLPLTNRREPPSKNHDSALAPTKSRVGKSVQPSSEENQFACSDPAHITTNSARWWDDASDSNCVLDDAPQVLYDDPIARKERKRLMALVEPPASKRVHPST
ncbi:protein kinase activating protein dpb11 [Malassezia psittaci]|uniref:Protein kinase activating protein dpb11 n=1 Tax=Malassezia psittaci TaxID=1821823 RepID=A0AAF0JMM3_9BASI|nr:protein kinase activating protein dpb11 [Malassezia psittaci]